jgi:peptide/nickel transport system substrate-binding protein
VNDKPTATNGLFKFKEWVKDDHFTANPSYKDFVRGEPNLDGYTYRILKDNTVRTQMFKTQDVDFAQPDPIDVEDLKKLPFANFVHYYSPTGGYTYIGIYPGNTPFLADKKVRQAITTAINRQEMVDKIVLGYGTPLHSFLHGANWAYSDNVPKFSYDAAKAKQMLKEAGFTPGSGGILQKDGKPFKINLYYNAGNKVREQIAIISQQYLKDVGIQAEVIAEEWNAYLERVRNTKKDLDLFVLGWTGGFDPHGTSNIWKTKMSQNYVLYSNAEVDKLFDEAASVPGCKQEDRAKVYAKIQQLIAEDQPYIFLYTPEAIEFYNKRVQLNPMSKLGVNYFIEKWEIVSAK